MERILTEKGVDGMTEKYKLEISEPHIEDTETGECYDLHGKDNLIYIVELWNKIAEENEELKQRNNRQAKQLDRLYHLIEEKDWRTLSDILDDFKRCEEQLQREWRTYGDIK